MKKILLIICIFVVSVFSNSSVYAEDTSETQPAGITSEFLFAYDLELGRVLYEQNADEKMYPASMTKVVSAMVAINLMEKNGVSLDDTVVITEDDLDTIFETGASAAYFIVGETVTYRDLLYGVILPSGADACRALAFNLAGSIDGFVDEMNNYVKSIGLTKTHFENPTGIHADNHYTTARDMAKIVEEAIKNETFYEVYTTFSYKTSNGLHSWANTAILYAGNADLNTSAIIGTKSGYTIEAQSCLASLVKINGRETITITAKTNSEESSPAMRDTLGLIELVKNSHGYVTVIEEDDALTEIPILYAHKMRNYKLVAPSNVTLFLPTGTTIDQLEIQYHIPDIIPDIHIGDRLGEYIILYQGIEVYREEIVSDIEIEKEFLPYVQYLIFDKYLPYTIGIILVAVYIGLVFVKPKRRQN